MANDIIGILKKINPDKEDIITLLRAEGEDRIALFRKASEIKEKYCGNKVYLRGLIEFSNICHKNCYYCGIRKGNTAVERYNLTDNEIIEAAGIALKNRWGSIALQSGELEHPEFTDRITRLLRGIRELSGGRLGITLSLGEQEEDVYREWFDAGAHRYLLRIESSNREIYSSLHPSDGNHSFDRRLECLRSLQKSGYQAGTGVMIGLPFQSVEDLADDLLFMRDIDIDMVGMGPYIEHDKTPLMDQSGSLLPLNDRFELTLNMIAVLRIVMKDINIAAATALQAIYPDGRVQAVNAGANIIMPNITPGRYRDNYELYHNKPLTKDMAGDCHGCLEESLAPGGHEIGYNEWGDSRHFFKRIKSHSRQK
jgi:biotin synthase